MDAQFHSDYTSATPAYTLDTGQAQVRFDADGKLTDVVGSVVSNPPLVTGLADGLSLKDVFNPEQVAEEMEWERIKDVPVHGW